jgi:hypothetical protein
MSTTYHDDSLLAQTIRWVRTHVSEPRTAAKYSDRVVLEYVGQSIAALLEDIYNVAPNPPGAKMTFTPEVGTDTYPIPANCKEFLRLYETDTDTGLVVWEIRPQSMYHPLGPKIQFDGLTSFSFVPKVDSGMAGRTLTFEYIPGGLVGSHVNWTKVWSDDDDTGTQLLTKTAMLLNPDTTTDYFLGTYDRRPRAYVGQRIRILGTLNDALPTDDDEAVIFPLMERAISTYSYATGSVEFDRALEIDPANLDDPLEIGQEEYTVVLYEVVPNIDPAVWWLGAYIACKSIAIDEKLWNTVKSLERDITPAKRALMMRWGNWNTSTGQSFDTSEWDWSDDGVS